MRLKVTVVLLCVVCILVGCGRKNAPLDQAIELRNAILNSDGCRFRTTVTADYGEKIYVFTMDCTTDKEGNLTFTVVNPDTIAGITGKISSTGGALTFDDKALMFPTIADGQVSPVTAPWLLIHTLRSGYLKGCAVTETGYEVSIDDSYAEESLQLLLDIEHQIPVSAEIFWQGRRVLTLKVENFTIL
ncbi:MAG: hypothetical protein J6V25_11570 [Oscillospiraceae bacterium]|nr:hypothetical protein [Oscillospiraceae bacterium]